jgi:hypothetical protein
MKTTLPFVLLPLLAAWAFCEEPQSHDAERTFSVAGTVVGSDGKPVARATLEVHNQLPAEDPFAERKGSHLASTKSDGKGAFAFRDVPWPTTAEPVQPAFGYVVAKAPGHGLAWSYFSVEQETPLAITLSEPAKVSGRVVDAGGKPIADAKVRAFRFQPLAMDYGSLELSPGFTATSDADGRFALEDMPRETRIDLKISDERYVTEEVSFVASGKPQPKEFADRESSRPIYTGDFTVALRPGRRMKGRVVFADSGKPAANFGLTFRSTAANTDTASFLQKLLPKQKTARPPRVVTVHATTDKDGRFSCGQISPGTYAYVTSVASRSLSVPGTEYVLVRGEISIPAGKTEIDHTIKLPRGAIVSGQVIDQETKKGIPDVQLAYGQPGVSEVGEALTESDGSFRLVVPPGQVWVRVTSAKKSSHFVHFESGTSYFDQSGRNAPFVKMVQAKLDSPVTGLTFALTRGLLVKGRVLDPQAKPVPGAKIFRLTEYRPSLQKHDLTSGGDGKFELSGLDPNKKYQLIVISDEQKLGLRMDVPGGKDKTKIDGLEIKLQPLGSVTGRVLKDDKTPMPDAPLTVSCLIQVQQQEFTYHTFVNYGHRGLKTDQDGRFTVTGLIPGVQHMVNASSQGYASFNSQFNTQAGKTHNVGDVVLPKADQSVAGVVIDLSGKPVERAQVNAYPRGRFGVSGNFTVQTDRTGRFKISNLPRGQVQIYVYVQSPSSGTMSQTNVVSEAGTQDIRVLLFASTDKPSVALGKPAPAFGVSGWVNRSVQGEEKQFRPSDFQGQVVLLAFVDEAKPSRRLLEQLEDLHDKLSDKGLTVLRVYEAALPEDISGTVKSISRLPAAIVRGGLIPGGYGEAFAKYGIRATPTLFLIDRQRVLRGIDVDAAELEAKVLAHLAP